MNTTIEKCLTVDEYAERLRVSRDKILGWIRSGKLKALNTSDATRPQYRITLESIEQFERGLESSTPLPAKQRRRTKPGKDRFDTE